MSLPYLPPYYLGSQEQLRSCIAAMQTPTSSGLSSSSFSIDSLLSSRVSLPMTMPSFTFGADLFHPAWPSTAAYSFLQSGLLPPPMMPSFLPSFHFGGKRKRRHRTIFSEEQLQILETTFTTTHYPDVTLREKLALQCDLKDERVEVWFKNRRAKERKQKREGSKEGAKISASDESDYEVSDEDESKPKRIRTEENDEKSAFKQREIVEKRSKETEKKTDSSI